MKIEEIKKIENKYNIKILYMTLSGSKLYGTDNEHSDTDMKFIFVPTVNDVLIKKDIEHVKIGIDTKIKNTKDDIDLDGISVHKFFELLRKGETGGIDILFSMWSPSIVFEDKTFTGAIKDNYKAFLNKKLHSFVGYAVGQASKYGIKGSRYKELIAFNDFFVRDVDTLIQENLKLSAYFTDIKAYFHEERPKYLKMTLDEGPKTGKGENVIEYVEILGKKYSGDITVGYFKERVIELEKQFGNRTKASVEGTDWKALSHSVRVLLEVEELLDTGFIEFPLTESVLIKAVKENKLPLEDVMEFISEKIDIVKEKLDKSNLPEKSNKKLMDEIELIILKMY